MATPKNHLRTIAALLPIVTAFSAGTAYAQAAPQVSPPTRDELNPGTEPLRDVAPRLSVEGDIERAPCPLADPAYADIKVDIGEVVLNNLKGATAAEMQAVTAPYLGAQQPIARICEIRDATATHLRDKGYLAAVQVPTQRIEGGVVRLEVLYARISAIRVRGQAGANERTVAGYLERLTEDEIFNRFDAERYLLLARDIPGLDVRLTLKPVTGQAGDLIGEVTVLSQPYEVDLNIQNLAARDTGNWGGQLRAQFFGLTGMGDRTMLSFYSTSDFEEQQIVQFSHDMKLGNDGLSLAGRFTYAWTQPGGTGVPAGGPQVEATTLYASLEASYPIIRRQTRNLRISGGLDFVDQDVDFIGPLSTDRLRVAYARLDFDAIDPAIAQAPKWRMSASLEARQGLSIFDASKGCRVIANCLTGATTPSRFDGDPTSTLLRFSGNFEYVLSPLLSVAVRPRAQLSFDPLLSFEEFSGGNYSIGRGYDPGSISGDDGVGVSFELRGPRIAPLRGKDLNLQPFVFVDSAWAWNDNVAGPGEPQKLTSVGGGIRGGLSDRFRLDMTLAVPTERVGFPGTRGDVRLLISLTAKLLPWKSR